MGKNIKKSYVFLNIFLVFDKFKIWASSQPAPGHLKNVKKKFMKSVNNSQSYARRKKSLSSRCMGASLRFAPINIRTFKKIHKSRVEFLNGFWHRPIVFSNIFLIFEKFKSDFFLRA